MSQLPKSLKKVVNGVDGDVLAVREVNSFEGGRSFDESVDRAVRQVGDLRTNGQRISIVDKEGGRVEMVGRTRTRPILRSLGS